MGRELLAESAEFAQWIERCEQALAPYVDWSLSAVLRGDEDAADLGRVDVASSPPGPTPPPPPCAG
ncbi:hypothetical protein SALBM217S_06623 [Streptomyces griseoloalbus]